ncbi:hypothetical protein [uncultured Vagococcus sp.]|uniref:hypothetical protein n=1 Tax=uncultured Vagococcus sp. TaxID=189676 RepID=UPI0028CFFE17|nr:hypothetical protein [uncultured Vagococcus sp.]
MYSTNTLLIALILAIVALVISIGSSIYFHLQIKGLKLDGSYYSEDDVEEVPHERPPRPDATAMGDTRIEWMNQITEYSEELITYTSEIFKASRTVIQQNIAIQKSMATAETHHLKTEQIANFNNSLDEFNVVTSKLRLTFFGDKKNAEILSTLKKITFVVDGEYEAQMDNDMSRHDALTEEYDRLIETYIDLTRKHLAVEWEKIKRGL